MNRTSVQFGESSAQAERNELLIGTLIRRDSVATLFRDSRRLYKINRRVALSSDNEVFRYERRALTRPDLIKAVFAELAMISRVDLTAVRLRYESP